MSTSFAEVLIDGINRLKSAAGAAIFGLLLVISSISTVASHSQAAAMGDIDFEEIRADLLEQAESDEEREAINALIDSVSNFFDQLVAAQTAFDIGLSDTVASTIGLVIWIPMVIVAIGGVTALAQNRQQLAASAFENLGWNLLNVVGGAILLGIGALVGLIMLAIASALLAIIPFVGWLAALLLWLTVPFVVGALLFYWLPAIAVDDENALEALSTSYKLARSNLLPTVGIVVVYGTLQIVSFVMFLWMLFSTPASVTAGTNLIFGVVTTTLVLAWMGAGYDLAKEARRQTAEGPGDDAWVSDGQHDDNSTTPAGGADETWNRGGKDPDRADRDSRTKSNDETWDRSSQSESTDADETWGTDEDEQSDDDKRQ